ncbi:MAG TPA: ROK family protein, partial [Anaerolineales bacterium]
MMAQAFELIKPRILPLLDEDFVPAVLTNRAFRQLASKDGIPLVIGLERAGGQLSRYEMKVLPESHPQAQSNYHYVERLVKFLLWQRGGHRLYIGGAASIGEFIQKVYSTEGERQFDFHFMGEQVYEKMFSVVVCNPDEVPAACETGQRLGRHLDGCRIGFDLGASDRKVSAVV